MSAVPTCRKCGCTDTDCRGCIARTGQPCYWVQPGLCSACFEETMSLIEGIAKEAGTKINMPRVRKLTLANIRRFDRKFKSTPSCPSPKPSSSPRRN